MNFVFKNLFIFVIVFILAILTVPTVLAVECSYQSSIQENHLDFKITSDIDKLAVVQYKRRSGSALVTSMSGPYVGLPWTYFDDPSCNVYVDFPVGCRQIRNEIQYGVLGTGAFWQWSNLGYYPYHALPNGIYGLDFSTSPTHESIGIQYGILSGDQPWVFCVRTGEISSPSPSPSPTPVTKTVFAPGLMASWNTEAILNCQTETNTEWTLAPYAKDVYEPIYQALNESGWTTLPFYYDWRQRISDNSQELANFIDENTSSEEKVNLVGHSMGGLVGRGYLDAFEGGKLSSLLAVGTPNKGSAYAYFPWEGGEIQRNSLIEKIALTIYVKHCGDKFDTDRQTVIENVPSLQDLLPTDEYLQRENNSILYLPADEENQNNWLNTLSSNSFGVKLGYLAGTGYQTLENIITTDPKKKDIKDGDWVDGRPSGEILSEEGDGTVLLSSATLTDVPEEYAYVVNQNHRSLVNSVEGMSKILEFLGSPQIETLGSTAFNWHDEPVSALVVIGYPADFIVVNENSETSSDDNGIVALMNPKSGNYKVNLISKSNETLFIVAQFLPNGEVKYKEYKFKGVGPKFKTLNYSIQNPQEDILK